MSKLRILLTAILLVVLLAGCEEKPIEPVPHVYEVTQSNTPECDSQTAEYVGDEIEIKDVNVENASIFGDITKFTDICKTKEINPIVFSNAKLKSYFFEISFEDIYPIRELNITNFLDDEEIAIKQMDIFISLDGESFDKIEDDLQLNTTDDKVTTIDLSNQLAKHIKFSFSSEVGKGNHGSDFFGINDISVVLGEGFIVKEATEWDEALTRYEGWTGADGIFSFNLNDGNDSINTPTDSTLFLFSDTILGTVDPNTFLRTYPKFLNNTIGYFNGDTSDIFNNMEFVWLEEESEVANVFEPDFYVGYHPSNLNNQIGLAQKEDLSYTYNYEISGSSWLSEESDNNPVITFDLMENTDITRLEVFNFVENTDFGTSKIRVSVSDDNLLYTEVGVYDLSDTTVTTELSGEGIQLSNVNTRYLQIEIIERQNPNSKQVGLSKVLLYNEDRLLHSQITASSYDATEKETMLHPRLWLQDGVVIGEYFYTFPLLVKDYETFFKVYKVGLIKVPIANKELDLSNIQYLDAPLQHEMSDGSIMYFGAGVNNMDTSGGLVHQDGYIYVYGYKDNSSGRHLVVARVEEEHFENFNQWTYFDGLTWSKDINKAKPLINGVSPELSVTYIPNGINSGKYMLVVMENTTSGKISISYSDTPEGPWTDYETVYLTSKIRELPGGYSYNAKMHPHLSEEGKYLVSYNVNTTGLTVMTNARIYHPRFIWLIETKHR